ncbi:hypothetical protein N7486_007675 [Penicillium sp. IBT 16267x]|nr:hypothetical protein N7486_007675 [Penicillium sp. IBT 16267x]
MWQTCTATLKSTAPVSSGLKSNRMSGTLTHGTLSTSLQKMAALMRFAYLRKFISPNPRQTEPLDARLRHKKIRLFHVACLHSRLEMAEYLLSCGSPLGVQLNDLNAIGSPLLSAVAALGTTKDSSGREVDKSEIEKFVHRLLDRGASVPQANIFRASENQLEQESPSRDLRETVLGLAAPYATYELASRLIAEGADVHAQQGWHEVGEGDVHNATALHLASGSWNLQFMQALVEHYADNGLAQAVVMADNKGRLPFHWALLGLRSSFDRRSEQETICEGLKVVRLLLEANPDTIDVQGQSGAAFNFAVAGRVHCAGQLALVKLLLDIKPHPSTLNARDQSGGTALLGVMKYHEGCRWSHEGYFMPLTDLLLSHGADRSLYDNEGQTVLHKLASSPTYNEEVSPHLLELLIPFVNINQADANSWTALHFMARNLRQVKASRLLVSRGADASVINKKGNTAPHEAMGGRLIRRQKEDGSLEWPTLPEKIQALDKIISILQEAGPSMDQPNVAGKTPAQLLVDKRARWEKGGE